LILFKIIGVIILHFHALINYATHNSIINFLLINKLEKTKDDNMINKRLSN